jgi:hypothetical protein
MKASEAKSLSLNAPLSDDDKRALYDIYTYVRGAADNGLLSTTIFGQTISIRAINSLTSDGYLVAVKSDRVEISWQYA